MSRRPVFVNRLNERGDLVRVEVAPDGYATPPAGRTSPTRERSPSPPLPPPPPPEQPIPISNNQNLTPSPPLPPPPPAEPEKIKEPHTVTQISKDLKSVDIVKDSETNAKSPTTPISPTPLRLYADRDIRALEKNPMHSDIMNAAEVFKGRREANSVSDDQNSVNGNDSTPTQKNDSNNYVRMVTSAPHPVYDPSEMRKKKQNSTVGNSEMRWNEPKPFEKRNTYRVVPKSQISSMIANVQNNVDQQRTSEATAPSNGGPYKKKEEVPDADALLELMATHDEKGKPIPDWKRKLMARNYRVKLCNQHQ